MCPSAWTARDERQFAHIQRNQRQAGRSKKQAAEIAARTVNKQRRLQRRTAEQMLQAGEVSAAQLQQRTRGELYSVARRLKIDGRSRMLKETLVTAILRARSQ